MVPRSGAASRGSRIPTTPPDSLHEFTRRPLNMDDKWAIRSTTDETKAGSWRRMTKNCSTLSDVRRADQSHSEHQFTRRSPALAASVPGLIETDPVSSEIRMYNGARKFFRENFESHDVLFTYGENYGAEDCDVPLVRHDFKSTRQAVDLDLWPYNSTRK